MPDTDTQEMRRLDGAGDLNAWYREVRMASEGLAAPLSAEDCQAQSMPDASPVKWHLAHTTWFFETFVLEPMAAAFRPFEPAFRVLFNSYYQSVGEQHPRPLRGLITRPSLADVRRYREHVDARVVAALERGGLDPAMLAIVELGLHHEQQHQELILTDVKHLLAQNRLLPAYQPAAAMDEATASGPLRWSTRDGGLDEVGHDGDGFAFDNETPRHQVYVAPYRLADRLVTNGEFLAFIEDGGYRDPALWLSDGWTAVCDRRWHAPLYWSRTAGGWREFTLAGVRDLRVDEPVTHISFYEADAYARWAGARLPSEAEWELAARAEPLSGNFVESAVLHPRPAGESGELRQLFGDVWEWTRSPYTAYPGYRPPAGALGEYNGKFMANQFVLRGGSCATPRSHIRATYRNFFLPDARWQFSGLRLARDA